MAVAVVQFGVSQRSAHKFYGGPRRYLQVFVHPDPEHLQRAARRYTGSSFKGTLGCCHPAPVRLRYDADGTAVERPYAHWAGMVRLSQGHITTEIVAHEMTHAALVIYRMDVKPDVRLGNDCRMREETLAYIVGDLIASATNALYQRGLWS